MRATGCMGGEMGHLKGSCVAPPFQWPANTLTLGSSIAPPLQPLLMRERLVEAVNFSQLMPAIPMPCTHWYGWQQPLRSHKGLSTTSRAT
jgi:hypothetical protein